MTDPVAPAPKKPPGIDGLKTASAVVTQLMTVSAGLLAFSVTFVSNFTAKDTTGVLSAHWTVKVAWAAWILAIAFGFWTHGAIVGTLDQIDRGEAESNAERTNISIPAQLMFFAFFLGLGFLVAAGFLVAH